MCTRLHVCTVHTVADECVEGSGKWLLTLTMEPLKKDWTAAGPGS